MTPEEIKKLIADARHNHPQEPELNCLGPDGCGTRCVIPALADLAEKQAVVVEASKKLLEARDLHVEACYCHPDNDCYDECEVTGKQVFMDSIETLRASLKALEEK